MQAIQGNRSAIEQIANALNCTTTQLQSAICNVQGAIDKVAGQVGMTSQAVINAVQQQGCEIGNQISSCCCNLQSAMASGFNNVQHSLDPIMNHLNAMKRTSTDIVNSVDKNKEIIEACDSILEDINPTFKQTKDQDRKIKNLEEKVDRMGSSFDELKELLIKKLG